MTTPRRTSTDLPANGDKPDELLVDVEINGMLNGAAVKLTARLRPTAIEGMIRGMRKAGWVFTAGPSVFSFTAEGTPICPKHGVTMSKRESRGDVWYSHATYGEDGAKHWCRGVECLSGQAWHDVRTYQAHERDDE
jgi:hypothetical protein